MKSLPVFVLAKVSVLQRGSFAQSLAVVLPSQRSVKRSFQVR